MFEPANAAFRNGTTKRRAKFVAAVAGRYDSDEAQNFMLQRPQQGNRHTYIRAAQKQVTKLGRPITLQAQRHCHLRGLRRLEPVGATVLCCLEFMLRFPPSLLSIRM